MVTAYAQATLLIWLLVGFWQGDRDAAYKIGYAVGLCCPLPLPILIIVAVYLLYKRSEQ